jgi:Putative transposase
LEFIRRFSLHILPSGLVRIRHYGILGNNRRKAAIEAARAIFFKHRGRAVELQLQSVLDPPWGATCCPLCGKAGIRLMAFTDAAGVLHMIGAGPMPCDSS